MSIIDFFKGMAASAEKKVGELALEQAANLERRKALDALDARIDQLVADGKIDPAEREEIRSRMAAAGADPKEIASMLRDLDSVSGSDALASKLGSAIRHQRGIAEDDQAEKGLELQFAVEDYRNGIESASALLKNEHDAYMNVIKNIL